MASPLLSDLTLQMCCFRGSSTTLNITGTSAGSLENCNFLSEDRVEEGKRIENKIGEDEGMEKVCKKVIKEKSIGEEG